MQTQVGPSYTKHIPHMCKVGFEMPHVMLSIVTTCSNTRSALAERNLGASFLLFPFLLVLFLSTQRLSSVPLYSRLHPFSPGKMRSTCRLQIFSPSPVPFSSCRRVFHFPFPLSSLCIAAFPFPCPPSLHPIITIAITGVSSAPLTGSEKQTRNKLQHRLLTFQDLHLSFACALG